jgi:hypothetical protein
MVMDNELILIENEVKSALHGSSSETWYWLFFLLPPASGKPEAAKHLK